MDGTERRETLGRSRDPLGHGGGHGMGTAPGKEPRGREGATACAGSPGPGESPWLECKPEMTFINMLFSVQPGSQFCSHS